MAGLLVAEAIAYAGKPLSQLAAEAIASAGGPRFTHRFDRSLSGMEQSWLLKLPEASATADRCWHPGAAYRLPRRPEIISRRWQLGSIPRLWN
ncbi:hypothetical protein [Neosynechococcus sphagnicola]|uniref:hypothetical protein n=1 Tax=Neosynechococcus sphagnicola TaxID=1501145 RepID=UPI001EF9FEC3|nr:hypothetical protein [Neosynechococcus sphagnicola]